MEDEDFNAVADRIQMSFDLQANSRLGVNFRNEGLTANVEFGASGEFGVVRFLWARQKFNNWSLLVGFTEDGTNQAGRQVFGGDNMLRGWGAVYNARNPMVRVEMDNGLYLALIRPFTGNDPAGTPGAIDALIPRINFGYNWAHNTVRLQPTFALQMYNYNEDFGGPDGSVMAWLGALTFDYNENQFGLKAHVNYGVNIGQMGYGAFMPIGHRHVVNAIWDASKNETSDTTTLGGLLTLSWDFNPRFNMNLGVGYVQSENDLVKEMTFVNPPPPGDDYDLVPMPFYEEGDTFTDSRMAVYLQGVFRARNLRIIPEVGLLDYMEDRFGNDRGTVMYFGTQFRLDF